MKELIRAAWRDPLAGVNALAIAHSLFSHVVAFPILGFVTGPALNLFILFAVRAARDAEVRVVALVAGGIAAFFRLCFIVVDIDGMEKVIGWGRFFGETKMNKAENIGTYAFWLTLAFDFVDIASVILAVYFASQKARSEAAAAAQAKREAEEAAARAAEQEAKREEIRLAQAKLDADWREAQAKMEAEQRELRAKLDKDLEVERMRENTRLQYNLAHIERKADNEAAVIAADLERAKLDLEAKRLASEAKPKEVERSEAKRSEVVVEAKRSEAQAKPTSEAKGNQAKRSEAVSTSEAKTPGEKWRALAELKRSEFLAAHGRLPFQKELAELMEISPKTLQTHKIL